MIEVRRTERFARWLDDLRDLRGRARIQARIERLAMGNPGDVAPVGEGVSELPVDVGPGYRVYFVQRGRTVIVLLQAAASAPKRRISGSRCSWRAVSRSRG